MFPKINPAGTKAWKLLQQHALKMKSVRMKDLFTEDPDRFTKHAHCLNDILIDFSKNILNEETLKHLLQLAEECKVKDAINAMYDGDLINETEKRSVLHIALRNYSGKAIYAAGED